ncbi:YcdB/YcdC domain-containing protein [Cytobacillus sp. FJAT-54145]|uniref:YcdB/YcdC domain-containing protein n=1 Tax=Cytobacillus spartinae TaxID=3299023 RepID=A0ABW6KB34_9BACI
MLKEELRKRARSMVKIPADFQTIIEEYADGENGDGEAMFSWINEERDEGITVKLDLEGNLTSLTIDMNHSHTNEINLSVEERQERAEQFLLLHYPNALEDLTFYEMKKLNDAYRFYYERIVMDLPLKHAGSLIDVDSEGNIVKFSYKAALEIPEIPTTLIQKEKLIEHVHNRLDFQQTITNLYTNLHHVAEDGIRLVYEPEPSFMTYKADVLSPTLSIVHDEDVQENYVSLQPPPNTAAQKDLSLETIIGITEGMEMIREVDMGEEKGVVWRDRNWKMEDHDLSMDSFFKRHSEDTVKAFISKKTGIVRSFVWFNERSGNLKLTREECLVKAIDFLQTILPDYDKYLQLMVRDSEEEFEDTRKKEVFSFRVHNGKGIPVQLEIVVVAVNRETGLVDHYSGPSMDIEQLSEISTEPAISKNEARDIFFNHLDFELSWNKDYGGESESYILVYQACDRYSRTPIRYIDARTGEVITAKDK